MGEEKEKKKKKKKNKEEKQEEEAAADEEGSKKKSSKKSSKKGSGSSETNLLACFTDVMLEEFKKGFAFMDQDKDGIISKADLFRAYDYIGKLVSDQELEDLIGESEVPITFTQMLTMFAERMQGQADDDDVIIDAFKKFDDGDGMIEPDLFRDMVKGKGDPLTLKETNEIWPELPRVDEGKKSHYISLKGIIEMLVSKGDEDEEEEEEEEAPVPAE